MSDFDLLVAPRPRLAAGILIAVLSGLSVQGCALDQLDQTDECLEAIAEHSNLLMEEAASLASPWDAPEVGCDDTGGPPAYAAFDLEPNTEDRFDDVLAREGWVCSVRTDVEDLPGADCTKAGEGVALELSTTEFLDIEGSVGVWITAETLRVA